MLTSTARNAVGHVMEIGCYLRFYPFRWNKTTRRLNIDITTFDYILFNLHGFTQCFMCLFSMVRFLTGLKEVEMPPRIRIMNLLWILAYIHGIQGFFELKFRGEQILYFSNTLFKYIDQNLDTPGKRERQAGNSGSGPNWVSGCVVLSYFLLVASPTLHGIMLLGSPCASHFSSSIYLECNSAGDNLGSWLEKLPFFLLENYLVAVFFFLLAFNWFIVFLGLGLLRTELRSMSVRMEAEEQERPTMAQLVSNYRHLECTITFLNEGFRLYLEWAPSIFMAHIGLLLFASIRFWDTDYISYLMFPVCGLRCMVDAVTPLAIAGYVNEESLKVLKIWKRLNAGYFLTVGEKNFSEVFLTSCKVITCRAGSLYDMKSSILPVNLNHLTQLTLNLLIAYPNKPRLSQIVPVVGAN